jgi:integrase
VVKKEQGRTFIDPKLADELFMPAAERYLRGRKLNADTLARYLGILRNHVSRAFAGRTLAYLATAEAAGEVEKLVNDTMEHIAARQRGVALMICRETMNAAQRAGKVATHKIVGIRLAEGTHISRRDLRADDEGAGLGFVFLTDAQVAALADGMTVTRKTKTGQDRKVALKGVGIAAVLQRKMGLRIREALGAEKADFRERRDGSRYLRLREQATEDGTGRCPLKHRKPGKGRDIPCPDDVWEAVQAMPDGPLCPGVGSRYLGYNTAWNRFAQVIAALGVEGFTTHSLRHQFAAETLEAVGVDNIAALSEVLGHKNVETTLRTYIHPSADAAGKIAAAMGATVKPKLAVAA